VSIAAVDASSLGADVNEVIVSLVSTGSGVAIAAAVKSFRKWAPRCKVEVEGEPDDGGFLDEDASGGAPGNS
jgi:hypothetical protein